MTEVAKRGRPVDREKLRQVLIIAREQFAVRGYRATTMREIAKEANITPRTLYKHYETKSSLFNACMQFNASEFPPISYSKTDNIHQKLKEFATDFVTQISISTNIQIFILVNREGSDFPEVRSATKHQVDTYLVQPLAKMLRAAGLEEKRSTRRTNLFLRMLTSEWSQRIMYGEHPLTNKEIAHHVDLVVDVFLNGSNIKP